MCVEDVVVSGLFLVRSYHRTWRNNKIDSTHQHSRLLQIEKGTREENAFNPLILWSPHANMSWRHDSFEQLQYLFNEMLSFRVSINIFSLVFVLPRCPVAVVVSPLRFCYWRCKIYTIFLPLHIFRVLRKYLCLRSMLWHVRSVHSTPVFFAFSCFFFLLRGVFLSL